jgi:ribosomal protein L7/L12
MNHFWPSISSFIFSTHYQSAPKLLLKDLKKEKADELKAQLEAVGALIEIE